MAIVAFEEPDLGSATDELRRLGRDFTFYILRHCQKIHVNPGLCRQLKVYASYLGVDVYHAQIENQFAVYVVEELELDDVKVTILFAGEYGRPARSGQYVWRGESDDELRAGIIQARVKAYFL